MVFVCESYAANNIAVRLARWERDSDSERATQKGSTKDECVCVCEREEFRLSDICVCDVSSLCCTATTSSSNEESEPSHHHSHTNKYYE